MPQVTLHLGDCLEVLSMLADQSADAIIADLPYGVTACKWDNPIPLEPLWEQYKRIIKPRGAVVLFGSQPFTSRLVMSNLEWFKYEWVWYQSHASNFMNAKRRPMLKHQNILVFCEGVSAYNPQMRKGKPKWSRVGKPIRPRKKTDGTQGGLPVCENIKTDLYYPHTVLEFSNGRRADSVHPTQKPIALMAYLVRTYTNGGETVLDNTMGSGSTGVGCVQTGRNFIGIEIMQEYFETAQERIAEAQAKARELRQLQMEMIP